MAKKIHHRLEQARGAAHLGLLRQASGKWHELSEDRTGQFAVHLVEPYRFIFIALGDPDVFVVDNQFQWEKITAIRFIEIVDYHN